MNVEPGSTRVSNIHENSLQLCTNLRFSHQVPEFEKTSKIPKFLQKNVFFHWKTQIVIKGALFRCTFGHPQYLFYRKYFFDQKFGIEISLTIKWGSGGKIWVWHIILHYFPEYLTPMLTLVPRSYRSPNLVLVLQMWENLESNLPVCIISPEIRNTLLCNVHGL
jgi:hypothetical protein